MNPVVYALFLGFGLMVIAFSSVFYAVSNVTVDPIQKDFEADTIQITTKRFVEDPSPPSIIRRIRKKNGVVTEYWRPYVNSKGFADMEMYGNNFTEVSK